MCSNNLETKEGGLREKDEDPGSPTHFLLTQAKKLHWRWKEVWSGYVGYKNKTAVFSQLGKFNHLTSNLSLSQRQLKPLSCYFGFFIADRMSLKIPNWRSKENISLNGKQRYTCSWGRIKVSIPPAWLSGCSDPTLAPSQKFTTERFLASPCGPFVLMVLFHLLCGTLLNWHCLVIGLQEVN